MLNFLQEVSLICVFQNDLVITDHIEAKLLKPVFPILFKTLFGVGGGRLSLISGCHGGCRLGYCTV